MPGKPYQSSLIPYEDEILSLRRQRPPVAFARIAELLKEKHQDSIQRAAICKFVKVCARWKRSTLASFPYLVERHILDKFGDLPLQKLSQFEFQDHLNKLGNSHSRSLVLHVRKLFRQILGEAVEQQYLQKNIALKLTLPKRMRKPSNRFLSLEEIAILDRDLPSRERLIFRLLALLGLRPGELFARRWRDWKGGRLLIEDAVYRGQIADPKTENSRGFVWLPKILQQNLADYKLTCRCAEPDDFIFRAEHGKSGRPLDTQNCLRRVFKPACGALGVKGVTHQSLRRTCSTYMLDIPQANLKDVQANLRHSSAETTLQIYVGDPGKRSAHCRANGQPHVSQKCGVNGGNRWETALSSDGV